MNEGFTEVGAKAAGFDLITSVSALEADLVDEIEPVVIGPGGQLYLLDGHHTFTALLDSVWAPTIRQFMSTSSLITRGHGRTVHRADAGQ